MTDRQTWRLGQHYLIHVYEGDRPVATFHDPIDARRAVEAVNADVCHACGLKILPDEPHYLDGQHRKHFPSGPPHLGELLS
jgi:hypothetical protein